ncbi:2'-5' RNA ligase family protein [Luteococcus sp. H154]
MSWPGHAVLQIPVPPLDGFVRGRYVHYDPSLLGTSELPGVGFVHAHVTVLGPFDQPPEPATVAGLVARMPAVDAHCRGVAVFPNGIIHCPAEPASAFTGLTALARESFPDVEPYRGQFGVEPHVTLDAIGPGVSVATVTEQLGGLLPVAFRADRLDLVWYETARTRLLGSWPLAGG